MSNTYASPPRGRGEQGVAGSRCSLYIDERWVRNQPLPWVNSRALPAGSAKVRASIPTSLNESFSTILSHSRSDHSAFPGLATTAMSSTSITTRVLPSILVTVKRTTPPQRTACGWAAHLTSSAATAGYPALGRGLKSVSRDDRSRNPVGMPCRRSRATTAGSVRRRCCPASAKAHSGGTSRAPRR